MGRDCASCKIKKKRQEEEIQRKLSQPSPPKKLPAFKVGIPNNEVKVSYTPPGELYKTYSKPTEKVPTRPRFSTYSNPSRSSTLVSRYENNLVSFDHFSEKRGKIIRRLANSSLTRNPHTINREVSCYSSLSLEKPLGKDIKGMLQRQNSFEFSPASDLPLASYHLPLSKYARRGRASISSVEVSSELRDKLNSSAALPSKIPTFKMHRKTSSSTCFPSRSSIRSLETPSPALSDLELYRSQSSLDWVSHKLPPMLPSDSAFATPRRRSRKPLPLDELGSVFHAPSYADQDHFNHSELSSIGLRLYNDGYGPFYSEDRPESSLNDTRTQSSCSQCRSDDTYLGPSEAIFDGDKFWEISDSNLPKSIQAYSESLNTPLPDDSPCECFEASGAPLPETDDLFDATCISLPVDANEECFEASCISLPDEKEVECFQASCAPLPAEDPADCFIPSCHSLPADRNEECFMASSVTLPDDEPTECFIASGHPLPDDRIEECFVATSISLPVESPVECFTASCCPLPDDPSEECFVASCIPLPDDNPVECFVASCHPLPEIKREECFVASCTSLPVEKSVDCFIASCCPLPGDLPEDCFVASCVSLPKEIPAECFEASCSPLPEDRIEDCFIASGIPLPDTDDRDLMVESKKEVIKSAKESNGDTGLSHDQGGEGVKIVSALKTTRNRVKNKTVTFEEPAEELKVSHPAPIPLPTTNWDRPAVVKTYPSLTPMFHAILVLIFFHTVLFLYSGFTSGDITMEHLTAWLVHLSQRIS